MGWAQSLRDVREYAMSSNGYKAFLIDFDGTLARASSYVSPAVALAVHKVAEELSVSIVSSRDHMAIGHMANNLGLRTLQIADAGARIFDPASGETAWLCPLGREDAERIIAFLERNNLLFSAVDGHKVARSSGEITEGTITRVTASKLTPSEAREIARAFGAMAGVHTEMIVRVDNGAWMVDFTHATATKGTAVVRYANLNGIEPSQIIGAGDSFNDIPLLRACGLRIAMGQAPDELKAIADYVAPTVDEDGLAVAIEELVLPILRGETPRPDLASSI